MDGYEIFTKAAKVTNKKGKAKKNAKAARSLAASQAAAKVRAHRAQAFDTKVRSKHCPWHRSARNLRQQLTGRADCR